MTLPPSPGSVPWSGFLTRSTMVCEIGLPCTGSVFLTEIVFISLLLFFSSCQEITMCIFFYPFPSLRLAPAPNKPLPPLGCLLGTLFSKHKSPGRIVLYQVSRKSVAQARRSSSVDKDTSPRWGEVEERKGKESFCSSHPCPFPSPALLSRLHWVSGATFLRGTWLSEHAHG